MSNKTRLQTNNTNLQALIDKANALPEVGSGGGSGGANVKVSFEYANNIHYTTIGGEYVARYVEDMANIEITVMKNTLITCGMGSSIVTYSSGLKKINTFTLVATGDGAVDFA